MAALNRLSGFISLAANVSAAVDSENRATYQRAIETAISFSTGTGTGGTTADLCYFDEISLAPSAGAASLDLSSLSQGGNSQNFLNPKYIAIFYLEGDGTFFLDRGATNGYTGFPADGVSVSKNRRAALLPVTVATSGSDKTLDYSETAAATVKVLLLIVGSAS